MNMPCPASAARAAAQACPCCGALTLTPFYEVRGVPVHSALKVLTRAAALHGPTGDLVLACCTACGFITNAAFDAGRMDYSAEYDGTQAFSPTFNAFHERLASDLIRRYDLHGKRVVEIGCGHGEFLQLLCLRGGNTGFGFDPAYAGSPAAEATPGLTIIKDVYSEARALPADFVCCKMTLEHIPDVGCFVETVRRGISADADPVVFFQVPDAARILREGAFWDVYYEHCSYFTRTSLAHLFRRHGFDVRRVWTAYGGQYLMLEAHLGGKPPPPPDPGTVRQIQAQATAFARHVAVQRTAWQRALRRLHAAGAHVALWGGGSKAVAFLTTLDLREEVDCVVDINPHKQGTFVAGTGQEIVGPDALSERAPSVVLVMNPVYHEEIRRMLAERSLAPRLLGIEHPLAGDLLAPTS